MAPQAHGSPLFRHESSLYEWNLRYPPQAGQIAYLPKLEKVEVAAEGVDRNGYNHPVVITAYFKEGAERMVDFMTITSFNGRGIHALSPADRSCYLPVSPAEPNPDLNIMLKLEHSRNLQKDTYVNVSRLYTIPSFVLKRWIVGIGMQSDIRLERESLRKMMAGTARIRQEQIELKIIMEVMFTGDMPRRLDAEYSDEHIKMNEEANVQGEEQTSWDCDGEDTAVQLDDVSVAASLRPGGPGQEEIRVLSHGLGLLYSLTESPVCWLICRKTSKKESGHCCVRWRHILHV